MSTADRFAIVEEMIALPFSGEGDASGGAGYGLRVLLASRDFWDDRSGETVEAAEEEIDAALRELVAALTARWGEPESVDLEPYLWAESPVPEPIQTLCGLSGKMLVWQRPDAGRWLALAVGQADPEFPIQLLAAVGEVPIPAVADL